MQFLQSTCLPIFYIMTVAMVANLLKCLPRGLFYKVMRFAPSVSVVLVAFQ